MPRALRSSRCGANDPQQTLAGLKSRSAALLCYPSAEARETPAVKRRELIAFLGGAAAGPLVARAQQLAMTVIGYLSQGTPDSEPDELAAFHQGLPLRKAIPWRRCCVWATGSSEIRCG